MRLKMTLLVLAMTAATASANEIGPLKETGDLGEMSIGGGYYYAESDWDTGSRLGDVLSRNVIRDGEFARLSIGLHPDLEVFGKVGLDSIQKGSSQGLSSDNDNFYALGAKAVLYRHDKWQVGPFLQYSKYSDYQLGANLVSGTSSIPLIANIKTFSTLEAGVGAMYNLDRIDLYGGAFYYKAEADVSGSFNGNGFSSVITEDADYGVYAGARYALTKRWNVAGELSSTSHLGAAISINYKFAEKKPPQVQVRNLVKTVYVERTEHVGPARLESEVRFTRDSAEINPDYLPNVREFAYFLIQYPKAKGIIEGHCDCDGTDSYNMKLSAKRSQAIEDMLIKVFGIDPARLSVQNFGEEKPVADNTTEAGKAANRRVRMVGVAK